MYSERRKSEETLLLIFGVEYSWHKILKLGTRQSAESIESDMSRQKHAQNWESIRRAISAPKISPDGPIKTESLSK